MQILTRSKVDIAQPRWIGPRYYTAKPKILIVLINPGAGATRRDDQDLKFNTILREYNAGGIGIHPVFDHIRGDMVNWGKLLSFCIRGFGLDLDEIAFANIAWSGEAANQHPSRMLDKCFNRHTQILLKILSPTLVILGGGDAARFKPRIETLLPNTKLVCVLHYAHREGKAAQSEDEARVRNLLDTLR